MIYLISDLHFFHNNILKFTKRPYVDLEEMHEGIVEEWNKEIKPTDTVYHLGDLSFLTGEQYPLYDILNRLNGNIVCLKGNHDYKMGEWGLDRAEGSLRDGIAFVGTPYMEIKYNKRKVVLCHYPIVSWNGSQRGTVHAHGHTHNSLTLDLGKAIDVSYDAIWENYGLKRPIDIEQFFDIVDAKEHAFFDNHKPKVEQK